LVDGIRQSPGGEREQEHRKAARNLDQRDLSGSGLRLVISHPDAASYIQVPALATTVAVQTTVKAR
jgi:hypothetical protein